MDRARFEELRALDSETRAYATAYTAFWADLTRGRHELLDILLTASDLDPQTRQELEAELETYESINQERKRSLPLRVFAPADMSPAIFGDWLYLGRAE